MGHYQNNLLLRRDEAIATAREFFSQKNQYAILETETTGLNHFDVVLWVTVMDLDGNILLDRLLKLPKYQQISSGAQHLHKIKRERLEKEGWDLWAVAPDLEALCQSRTMLIYNAEFHTTMMTQTFNKHDMPPITIKSRDVQLLHNLFQGSQYLKLPDRKNTGEGDCRAVLALLKSIAESELSLSAQKQSNNDRSDLAWVIAVVSIFFLFVLYKACS